MTKYVQRWEFVPTTPEFKRLQAATQEDNILDGKIEITRSTMRIGIPTILLPNENNLILQDSSKEFTLDLIGYYTVIKHWEFPQYTLTPSPQEIKFPSQLTKTFFVTINNQSDTLDSRNHKIIIDSEHANVFYCNNKEDKSHTDIEPVNGAMCHVSLKKGHTLNVCHKSSEYKFVIYNNKDGFIFNLNSEINQLKFKDSMYALNESDKYIDTIFCFDEVIVNASGNMLIETTE